MSNWSSWKMDKCVVQWEYKYLQKVYGKSTGEQICATYNKVQNKRNGYGDYEVPPEPDDDELVAFSNNPFSNSSNTYSSPFDKKQDHANVPTLA